MWKVIINESDFWMVIVFQKLVVDIVWFVRQKKSFKIKKTGNQKEFCWQKILIIYLKCNAVNKLGRRKKKKKKKFVFWGKDPSWKDMTTAISADTCVATEWNLVLIFLVISMVQTIGAINMFKNLFKLQFHNMAVMNRWHSGVLFVVQTVRIH